MLELVVLSSVTKTNKSAQRCNEGFNRKGISREDVSLHHIRKHFLQSQEVISERFLVDFSLFACLLACKERCIVAHQGPKDLLDQDREEGWGKGVAKAAHDCVQIRYHLSIPDLGSKAPPPIQCLQWQSQPSLHDSDGQQIRDVVRLSLHGRTEDRSCRQGRGTQARW